jgi:hypothetical protein
VRQRGLRRVRFPPASGVGETRPAAGSCRVGGMRPLPRTAHHPEASPVPVLGASGAGWVTIVVPHGRGRAPAPDSRFILQGSLDPTSRRVLGRDGRRQGLERHDRLHSLPKATLCSFHRTLRRVRSEGNAGHGTGEAGTAGPLRAAKARCPAPRMLARDRRSASPGALPTERGAAGKPQAQASRKLGPAGASSRDPAGTRRTVSGSGPP